MNILNNKSFFFRINHQHELEFKSVWDFEGLKNKLSKYQLAVYDKDTDDDEDIAINGDSPESLIFRNLSESCMIVDMFLESPIYREYKLLGTKEKELKIQNKYFSPDYPAYNFPDGYQFCYTFCLKPYVPENNDGDGDGNLEKDATPAILLDLPSVIPRSDTVYKAKGKVVGLETFKNVNMLVKFGKWEKLEIQKESYQVDEYGNFEISLDLSKLIDGHPYIQLTTINTRNPDGVYLDRIFNDNDLTRSSEVRIDDPLVVRIDLKGLESEEISVYTMGGTNTAWYIDWGDGVITTKSDLSYEFEAKHTYKNTGKDYICKVYSGNTTMYNFGIGNRIAEKGIGKDTYSLVEVLSFGTAGYPAFLNCKGLVEVPTYIPKYTGTKLNSMFSYATSFNSPNILKWDWSNVGYVDSMLENASSFAQDMSNITIHLYKSSAYADLYGAPYGFATGTKLTPEMYPKFIYSDQ